MIYYDLYVRINNNDFLNFTSSIAGVRSFFFFCSSLRVMQLNEFW